MFYLVYYGTKPHNEYPNGEDVKEKPNKGERNKKGRNERKIKTNGKKMRNIGRYEMINI